MSEKERVEFESWYRSKYGAMGSYEQWSKTDVIYLFVAWQASAARYQSRIAELETEVWRLKARLVDKGMTAEDKARNYINNKNADAERYQWLEIYAEVEWDRSYESVQVSFTAPKSLRAIESLSAAIDEAMKGGD
jgi:hypothetical protein